MVPGIVNLPYHTGPDGKGLPVEVIEELIQIIKQGLFTEDQINQAIKLCLDASTQQQWNETYIHLLLENLRED